MSHVDRIFKFISDPRVRAGIEFEIAHPLPEMGTRFLPSGMADRAFFYTKTSDLLDPVYVHSSPWDNQLALKNIDGYESNEKPLRVSFFVLNRVLGLPDIRPLPPRHVQCDPQDALRLYAEELTSDPVRRIQDELHEQSIYAGVDYHVLQSDRGQKILEQAYIFIPHERAEKVYGKFMSVSNMDQVDRFVAYLARQGFIDLQRDEAEIVKAFGLRAHIQATIMTACVNPAVPSPGF